MNFADKVTGALELLDTWVSIYDAIREEDLTIHALDLGPHFQSKYMDNLEEDLDLLETRMGKDLKSLAQSTWSVMRRARTAERDDPDYDDVTRQYESWLAELTGMIIPLLDTIPEIPEPMPVITNSSGVAPNEDDLPF